MKNIVLLVLGLLSPAGAFSAPCDLNQAWSYWAKGDIETSLSCARRLKGLHREDLNSKNHLLLNIQFVKGNYQYVTQRFQEIPSSYKESRSVIGLVIQVFLHLHQCQDALEIALAAGIDDPNALAALQTMADSPASYHLTDLDIIPFKKDEVTQFMPAFDVKVDGKSLVAYFDTGANYVAMSPKLADHLGIKYIFIGNGNASDKPTKIWLGKADFDLGELKVKNAPVYVLESLSGPGIDSRPIFGTALLMDFLVTLDYPKQRLILSPKGNWKARRRHLAMLRAPISRMKFYLWSDHYMFARGSIGENSGLNFFIDSGLLAFNQSGKQAAFYGETQKFLNWGYPEDSLQSSFVDLQGQLRLGNLAQENHIALHSDHFPVPTLGGITIDGLISHAFLKNYVWTIDFLERKYLFSESD